MAAFLKFNAANNYFENTRMMKTGWIFPVIWKYGQKLKLIDSINELKRLK